MAPVWVSTIGTILYYISLPITIIFRWTLIALAPILHLAHYALLGLLLPVRLLAKFETLYIFLGVAALIGLITGSILHVQSSVLVSLFNLDSKPEERTPLRSLKERRELKEKADSSSGGELKWKVDPSVERKYSEWLEKKQEDDRGLFTQTIIEEDDDSEDGF